MTLSVHALAVRQLADYLAGTPGTWFAEPGRPEAEPAAHVCHDSPFASLELAARENQLARVHRLAERSCAPRCATRSPSR